MWLDSLQTFIASNQPVPQELLYDIDSYQGGSISSTPVDILTPKSNLSRDNLDELESSTTAITQTTVTDNPFSEVHMEEKLQEKIDNSNSNLLPDGIPKSPHLGKDFSPSGERIHNSMRARRRQRYLQAQHSGNVGEDHSTDRVLQAVKDSLQSGGESNKNKTNKRNLDRGFILDINRSGILHINNVRDLNNLSDFDSSCDTSLNYHEVNSLDEVPVPSQLSNGKNMHVETKDNTLNTIQEMHTTDVLKKSQPCIEKLEENNENIIKVSPPDVSVSTSRSAVKDEQTSLDSLNNIKRNSSDKSIKIALEDFRTRLNLCKTKFDAIDEANRKNFNNSQNSMRSLFKVHTNEDVYKSPPESMKMFQRFKPTKTTVGSPEAEVKNTYRVNQTPVFGRKLQTKPTEFYKPHSDSLENLDKIGQSDNNKNDKKETSPPKRPKLPKESTFKSYITSLDIIPATEGRTSPKKEISTRLRVSSNLMSIRKTLNLSPTPIRNEEIKSFSRRTLSPTKSSEAKRVTPTKPDLPTSKFLIILGNSKSFRLIQKMTSIDFNYI